MLFKQIGYFGIKRTEMFPYCNSCTRQMSTKLIKFGAEYNFIINNSLY